MFIGLICRMLRGIEAHKNLKNSETKHYTILCGVALTKARVLKLPDLTPT